MLHATARPILLIHKTCTIEPPNNGCTWDMNFVHYREVSLIILEVRCPLFRLSDVQRYVYIYTCIAREQSK